MAAQKDLFDHVEELPPAVQALLVDYALIDKMDEQDVTKMSSELKAHGYTFDLAEGNTPTNLRLINGVKRPTSYVGAEVLSDENKNRVIIAAIQSCTDGHFDRLKDTLIDLHLIEMERDLFDHVDELPANVQAILVDFALEDGDATVMHELETRLKAEGYTFDWGLSYEPMNLRQIVPDIAIEDADKELLDQLNITSAADKHSAIITAIEASDNDDIGMLKDTLVDFELIRPSANMAM